MLRDSRGLHLADDLGNARKELDEGDQPERPATAMSRSMTAGGCGRRRRLAFTNEVRLDAAEEWLYVAETCARKVTRLRRPADGSLTDHLRLSGREDHGAYIDGIAFDALSNLWGTHVFTDRIFAITPEGELLILLDRATVAALQDQAFLSAFARDEAARN